MLGSPLEVECSGAVVDSAIAVHQEFGPGLYEALYVRCLVTELRLRGVSADMEVPLSANYKGVDLGVGYRLDLVVGGCVIVEVKAVRQLTEVHHAQLLTYLRLTRRRVGLLLNFNCALMKHGIKRVYNTH